MATVAVVVGVSYVDLVDESNNINKIDAAAAEVGLSSFGQMPKPDCITDMFVGVVFRKRPTDAQVAEATQRVQGLLPRLSELLGPASSDVETWLTVDVG